MIRIAWAAYVVVLTAFLLVPNPAALVGLSRVPGPSGGRGVHFLAFAVLAALSCAARWPIHRVRLAALLVIFALAIESLQVLVPRRTVELLDYAENLGGLIVGTAAWWIVQHGASASEPIRRWIRSSFKAPR